MFLRHSRPLHPKDQVVDAQFPLIAADFPDHILRGPQQEPVSGQILIGNGKTFLAGQRLVLPPGGVSSVFGCQVRLAFHIGRFPVLGHIKLPHHRESLRSGLAGLLQACLIPLPLTGNHFHCGVGIDQPRVTPTSSAADRNIIVGGNPDGRMGLLHRARSRGHPRHPVILALELHLFLSPKQFHYLQGFPKAGYPLPALQAEGGIFFVTVSQTHAEDKAPVAYGIHGGDAFGQLHRIMQRHQNHGGGYFHIPGLCRHPSQQGERGAHLVGSGKVMLAGANQVEPGISRRPHLFGALLNFTGHGFARQILVGDEETYFHYYSCGAAALAGLGVWRLVLDYTWYSKP